MSRKIAYFVLGCCMALSCHSCIRPPDVEPNTAIGNFDALWKIIDTRYCYLDYKKINWDSIYTAYRPRIDTINSKYKLFDLLGEMLAELKDGHVNLYSEFDLSRYWKWYSDYYSNFDSDLIFNQRYLSNNYRIAGPFRYKQIAGGQVGYVYYSSFSNSFGSANILSVFELFSDCRGIIIDVRNNGGGLLTNSEALASYFFTEKKLTGYISHKTGSGHTDFSEPTPIYTYPHGTINWRRPVVILTNRMSYSATNEFVCRMKYAPRAIIIGDVTGGGGGMPLSSELPIGWMVRFSASPMFNAEMENIEWGIEPHIRTMLKDADRKKGYDTLIELAVSEIME